MCVCVCVCVSFFLFTNLVPVRGAIWSGESAEIPSPVDPAVVLKAAVYDLHDRLVFRWRALHLSLGQWVGILCASTMRA